MGKEKDITLIRSNNMAMVRVVSLFLSFLLVLLIFIIDPIFAAKIFKADLGPDTIDVSGYPPEMQGYYKLFAKKCSKHHTLARPINSNFDPIEWKKYVRRMMRKPRSDINGAEGENIYKFLAYYSSKKGNMEETIKQPILIDKELATFIENTMYYLKTTGFSPATTKIPETITKLKILVMFRRDADLKELIEEDERQKITRYIPEKRFKGEVLLMKPTIYRKELASPPPIDTQEHLMYRKASDIIQSDNPLMKQKAKEISAGAKDSIEAVKKITIYVNRIMAQEFRRGFLSSMEVLNAPVGDASEYAFLFAGLARAKGIPTRVVPGFVYKRNSLYLHFWNEVFIGKWIAIDPMLRQLPIDATHIKFKGFDTDEKLKRFPALIDRYSGLVTQLVTYN